MGHHGNYGKLVLQLAAGDNFECYGKSVEIDYGAGGPARIDGTVSGKVAVEVEARTPKQVRGAVLDLLCHEHSKKLLLILPVKNMSNPDDVATQCRNALLRFISPDDFRVVVLRGHGANQKLQQDADVTRSALHELGAFV